MMVKGMISNTAYVHYCIPQCKALDLISFPIVKQNSTSPQILFQQATFGEKLFTQKQRGFFTHFHVIICETQKEKF